MSFSYSIIKDTERYVEIKLVNTGISVSSTKILDASALNHTDGKNTELLNLVKILVSVDPHKHLAGKIYWADSLGAASATPTFIIGGSLSGHISVGIPNDVSGSNGDVWFESDNNIYCIILTFEKVSGFYSSRKKVYAP
jgi:hypothetical protein